MCNPVLLGKIQTRIEISRMHVRSDKLLLLSEHIEDLAVEVERSPQ